MPGECIEAIGGGGELFCNSGHRPTTAPVGLVEALKVSSDTYFFDRRRARQQGPRRRDPEQGPRAGYRREDGDRPAERARPARFPSPAVAGRTEQRIDCQVQSANTHGHHGTCQIVAEPGRAVDRRLQHGPGRRPGQTCRPTPLQMAVAYSTLANAYRQRRGEGDRRHTAHLGMPDRRIERRACAEPKPELPAQTTCASELRRPESIVMEGIHEAASASRGALRQMYGPAGTNRTASCLWQDRYGRTPSGHLEDQSWYMCYIADPKRPIVIAVTVEEGGFGAETAAPIARLIASQVVRPAREVRRGNFENLLIFRTMSPSVYHRSPSLSVIPAARRAL